MFKICSLLCTYHANFSNIRIFDDLFYHVLATSYVGREDMNPQFQLLFQQPQARNLAVCNASHKEYIDIFNFLLLLSSSHEVLFPK